MYHVFAGIAIIIAALLIITGYPYVAIAISFAGIIANIIKIRYF